MTTLSSNITVMLEGRGRVILRPTDHVATGGQAAVYLASKTIVKLYLDAQKERKRGIVERLRLLKALRHPYIVSPVNLITSPSGDVIGYYMDLAPGEPLPRFFTNDFRTREGLTDASAATLVNRMRDVIAFALAEGACPIDANEVNWNAVAKGKNGPEPFAFDVDAWGIGQWPATVIMPSVKDWHTPDFNDKSCWFTWGCVTFQIWTGIHPYKGTLAGFDRKDLEGRMKANASVFTPGIRLNTAVRDFSCIPGPLLSWYEAVFQNGERSVPPSPFDTAKAATAARVMRVVTTSATGRLKYEKIVAHAGDPVIRVFPCGIALTASGHLIDLSTLRTVGSQHTNRVEVIRVEGGWLCGEKHNENIRFFFIDSIARTEEELSFPLQGRGIFRAENRLFVITETGLVEIAFYNLGKPLVSAKQTWGAMVNSTKWFENVGIQDALGATHLVLPFDQQSFTYLRVRELDGIQPVNAKAGTRFVTVIGIDQSGDYHKMEFTLDKDHQTYAFWQGPTDGPDLNAAFLPRGVCVTITDDGEICAYVPANGNLNKVQDKQITANLLLANWDNRVVYIKDGEVWGLTMQ